ncbi:sugar ABC transporter ATP-binding protein [Christensenella tenuis]|uniref:Sugar ABC transporter ATP-binding protein n=1 Tax=Christensenella tenuis TaxID=2763033 RepID=A0ABR7EDV5_9FIRM|nr:sugar ABC transporter ATP-binding protein [Christensenella tenuis]MBC5647967.1 sugar ABC transporter ATP-binding protein [Christensenella tenuis]
MENEYYLEMSGISKTFPGAKVLDNIEFNVKAGEVRALMGENGAGKSTLIKILGGIYDMDSGQGTIRINGEEAKINTVQDAQHYGIGIIHQEISLAENMSIADNLFMGKEIKGGALLNDREMVRRSQAILEEMGLGVDARTKVRDLSIAKQQMVEISRALLSNAKIIVMDEPTSSLTKTEIDQLFLQIENLKKSGIAIIYISHRMDEIFEIADSISILRDGKMIGTDTVENLTQDKVISMMVGRELSEIFKRDGKIDVGEVCLEVKHYSNEKIRDINFSLRKGEIVGFAGLVGAGRTELARAIFGIDKVDSGELYINGERANIQNTQDAIRYGIGYVPEDRKTEGLFLMHTIKYNTSIVVLDKFIKNVGVNKKYENELIGKYADALSIKMTSPEQKVQFLSGGNQQKVVLGKWMAADPDIFILDEPTRGVDVGAKAEIYQLIYGLAKQGKAVMLISSEMEEIINLSDRIVVMHEGSVTGVLDNNETSRAKQEEIMWFASGGKENAKN